MQRVVPLFHGRATLLHLCLFPFTSGPYGTLNWVTRDTGYGTQACQECVCSRFQMLFFAVNLFTNLGTFSV